MRIRKHRERSQGGQEQVLRGGTPAPSPDRDDVDAPTPVALATALQQRPHALTPTTLGHLRGAPNSAVVAVHRAPPGGGGTDAPANLGDHPLRAAYRAEVEGLQALEDSMRADGAEPEAIARALHQQRREIGKKYKDLTPEPLRSQIRERNLAKYGDEWGPTISYLREAGKSWEQIIAGAKRTGGADLGLAKTS